MKTRFLKPKMWAALFAIAILILLLWPPIHQVLAVAAVQNSVERGWEITFGAETLPPGLPASVDAKVEELFFRMFSDVPGKDDAKPQHSRNREDIYHERFRAFFRGPIQKIEIFYPEGFRGDLGAALARFPGLRSVTVDENDSNLPTEADWKLLCTRLRALPDLEEVELGGDMLTDAALAPLSGHPKIKKVTMVDGRLTDKSIQTFASMPGLRELHIEGIGSGDTEWPMIESQIALKAALPNVKLDDPMDPPEAEPTPDTAPP